ncbi:Thioesterase/thiol ester dehydrase-isomerase [Choiromyces venosus 120613-1]|uniref:Thioesterase/thiol ester dehydrase-isomerase n=1 Tax=Choiromyces venosus 120613-1 TaxID=1336337 RepID=A0A3N4JHY4_9PEZI|nr:Thioesterase/thiol ester dehydrase-isomerase [Choiromyces venosus 120613-1]
MSKRAAMSFVNSVWSSFHASSGLEPTLLSTLKLINVEPGKVEFELLIEKMHTNRLGTLHGGTIASMVDLGGSLAVASKGLFSTGVSTDLNVTYLTSGGKVGHVVRGEATCDKFGKTLAYTTVLFHNKDNQLVARGSHTKYVKIALTDPKNILEELSPELNNDTSRRVKGF